MFRISGFLADDFDWRLVAIACFVSAVAVVATVNLMRRAISVRGAARAAWFVSSAVASICGAASGYFFLVGVHDSPPTELRRALVVAAITLLVLGAGILLTAMDRRFKQKNALLDTALNNMSHGLMMFDKNSRVILCNQHYCDLYGLPAGAIKAGITLREVIDRRIATGTFKGDAGAYCANVLNVVSRGETSRQVTTTPDGRMIEVAGVPLADGGWVATHRDITEERRREASFRFLFEDNPLPMWVWDHATLRFLAVNNAALEKYGYDREHFLTLTLRDTKRTADFDAIKGVASGDERKLRAGLVSRHGKADGTLFDVELYGRSMVYEGRAASLVAGLDITERRHAESELRRTRTFLDTIIENMPAILTVKDARDLRYVLVNRTAEQFFGRKRGEIIGKSARDILPRHPAEIFDAHDREVISSGSLKTLDEHPVQMPQGQRLLTTKKLLVRDEDGRAQYVLTLSEDVTDRKLARDQIAHMTSHDPLTDLPNRAAFNQMLDATLQGAMPSKNPFAVLCIDIDRFKEVNDVFGHAAGDQLLCEVARRLTEAAGDSFLARLGSDEFAIIVAQGVQPATAESIADRLLRAMAADVAMGDQTAHVGLSVGVAVFPTDGEDATALLANTNAALYRAKTGGRGTIRFFEAHMDERLREGRALQHELRAAIEHQELTLHYQPQARIGGEVIGFEALVRWHHPIRGMIPPGTFIPAAEDSGLIVEMGQWILREACREAASWRKPLQVAVNLSPIQFRDADLPSLVHEILLETGLAPRRLELEITEGVLISDYARAISMLRRLKGLGVSIAMDDFGTGYSSLSYLQSFPFDKIKIDRTFIANLTDNHYSAAIVRAVIGLGHGLGLPVIAEGVETAEQLAFLTRESCDEVQGFLLGRPSPIDEYAEIVGRKAVPKLKLVSR